MPIAVKIQAVIEKSSWIRKMFEEGARLKALHGAENVYDFSLGNPNVPPPEIFEKTLRELVDSGEARDHGYMPNTGYPFVRQAVADHVGRVQGAAITADDVIMTCGAAGALNAVFKALLDPGDEVLVPAPYFVEYNAYADNHGGILKTVPTREDFTLDLAAIDAAVTEKTKIVLINSPNNPTGQIYDAESLAALGRLLLDRGEAMGRAIYLVSDEPYRNIVYDGATVPGIFTASPNSIVATSYSKELSIPGERLGYIAVNPAVDDRRNLLAALALTNRILGFVNAPSMMQRVVARLQGVTVDVSEYDRKRRLLCKGLAECGYDFITPPGAFYLFPKSPIPDDVAFVQALQEERILAVPGSGFGGPGHFRIAYCVDDKTITGAMPGFKRTIEKYR
ncbi:MULTISPECIES: pyridoxal phosphate-dependent aminotransferase [Desulfococcus]|jgi:aspartate aminotransferase|uniref:Aminotransferase n=1 Tax=Desulfococcus multivorans DSM 2059 TaxID=1121405 RepID=S7U5M9_DESML|nr:pyridoxal phosphate-dependent aminotransferase [Desulfococcus multivorans]AOY60257.1 AspC2: aspartate aminotransferase [Desulfococcus multivorans]AQV02369.1 aspartate aminotransferase [Desulfococcus multivorans]EPR44647.1 aminotransferase class I and II [Desulfococcus multivorans DSM 2059]MDX9818976.1 pyridoxal phosphate-dependent aminotransferase [Desulfococcus multivorans]SKA07821.1 aspartate aminotransferase [Desulfococcus multivorans DSM 2059]